MKYFVFVNALLSYGLCANITKINYEYKNQNITEIVSNNPSVTIKNEIEQYSSKHHKSREGKCEISF